MRSSNETPDPDFFWDCIGVAVIIAAFALVALVDRRPTPLADPFPFTAEAQGGR